MAIAALLTVLLAACSGPILANPPLVPVAPPTPTPGPTRPPDPQPIVFPRDDGPHDRLTEWWYYTGHLQDDEGGRWGFEFVIFRAERGGFPVSWASHVAITDEVAGTFRYDQRSEIGPQVDGTSVGAEHPISLWLRDPAAPVLSEPTAVPSLDPRDQLPTSWAMGGDSSSTDLLAGFDGGTTGFALRTEAPPLVPVVLHGGNGWVDFGPAGGSYYYSRTRFAVSGLLLSDGPHDVTGTAWFDHQWGDFISVGGGGWDWFAVNLDDGTDLTISLIRAADGGYPLVYGTLVDADGTVRHLERRAFEVEADPSRTWASPSTGATYPAGWTIRIPGEGLLIDLEPTVADQELDTRPTTGVVYWEGSQVVRATRDGSPLGGEAYVELTGYAPAIP
ncbi:MAG: lipocalin family protein [Chloroflexota bacterium]